MPETVQTMQDMVDRLWQRIHRLEAELSDRDAQWERAIRERWVEEYDELGHWVENVNIEDDLAAIRERLAKGQDR